MSAAGSRASKGPSQSSAVAKEFPLAAQEEPVLPEDELEAFLQEASDAIVENEGDDASVPPGGPAHRRLKVVVSGDGLEAHLEAVFLDTTIDEVREALTHARVAWGIDEVPVSDALKRAEKTGRAQRDVPVATGQPAVYLKRRVVSYPFLDGLHDPKSGEPLHHASYVFREIREVLTRTDINLIRGYAKPVVAAAPGALLMIAEGEDEVQPGRDVCGVEIKQISDTGPGPLKAGDGVEETTGGRMAASRFGYVAVSGQFLSVLSPTWISPDRMEAYFVVPPQMGGYKPPGEQDVLNGLTELNVTFGVDKDVIRQMCLNMKRGDTVESCVRIVKGRRSLPGPAILVAEVQWKWMSALRAVSNTGSLMNPGTPNA